MHVIVEVEIELGMCIRRSRNRGEVGEIEFGPLDVAKRSEANIDAQSPTAYIWQKNINI